MASTKPSKSLLKRLNKSNIRIEDHTGVTYRVPPVKELQDPIQRYLPPACQYYDQRVLEEALGSTDHRAKCALCWNGKIAGEKCECKDKCVLCGTKQHRGRDCPRVYASIKWWQNHGHRLRKRAQLRPNPGERAYLVVAGILKDWNRVEDPVVVNMDHPTVKAFYGGNAPRALTDLPGNLRPTSAAMTIETNTEFGASEASPATGNPIDTGTAPIPKSAKYCKPGSLWKQEVNVSVKNKTETVHGRRQLVQISAKGNDSFLDELLEKKWQPSSYHEGARLATITPLSIRLAISNAQQLSIASQLASCNISNVHPDLDPRLQARASAPDTACGPIASSYDVPHGHIVGTSEGRGGENKCIDYREELQKAQEEIRAKDRRIRELELALHETEGWTDAVTYTGGQKRPRI